MRKEKETQRNATMARERDKPLAEPLLASEPVEVTIENNSHEEQSPPQSRNINLILAYTGFAFAGRSLWSQSVLSTFVYLLRNDNPEAVGLITAVMGMSQLIISFPTGIMADRYRRDSYLQLGSAVGLVAVGVTLFSLWKDSYQWLTVALAVWGLMWGISSTSISALFADSIHDGDRSYYFTQLSIIIKVGNTAGPLVALVLFALLGDEWTLRDCAIVMGVGQLLCLPAVFLLCFLSDDAAVPEVPQNGLTEALLEGSTASDSSSSDSNEDTTLESEETQRMPWPCCCLPEHRVIPVLVALADVMGGLGAGMSIRYFPIFFFDNLKLSPVLVQILYVVSPLGQAVLMQAGQVWAIRIGRCKMAVVFKWIGVLSMMTMIVSYLCHLPTWWVCLVYLLRTSFMNATSALTKSVLMDAVPKSERGKWSALESVNMFSWSGSAALGGLLVGFKGIIFNFAVTGAIQFLATLPLVLLFSREGLEGAKPRLVSNEGDNEEYLESTATRRSNRSETN